MAVTVRLLLSRVKPFRPDLPDEYAMHGLRTAMAQIATRSFALTVTDPCEVVSAGNYQSDWSNKNSTRTVRITKVEGLSTYKIRTEVGVSTAMAYQGGYDAATSTPALPTPGTGNVGYYYLVTVPSGDYSIGDVVYSDGTAWSIYKPYPDEATSNSVDAMAMIPQANKPSVEFKAANPQAGRDYLPHTWCQQDGDIVWMYPPKEELIVRVTRCIDYGTASDLDMDAIEIPSDIESVMTDGALSYIYGIPGEHQDKNLAEAKRRQFEAGLASLRAMAIFGQGGSPRMQYSNFAGRRTF